ncbi:MULTISPECIES: hypothetical protein [unclassified Caulobacter]|uniref:hypothetical protein n=1 Tax=unclassified Caulobacter TaxID=2648921 RepID=UPI000702291C|nr:MULTISPECIES: hypothetical protein [unclassified Caulobacter]KQV62524.1 hypothetical protein ASC62_03035 [Caulobacter sp. Root342]KQV65466.1 hypothetical protein ASC70_17265 [Caulobacter sp. Root343]
MDAIEIFYACYGVALALAFAKVLAGAARLISHRKTIRIGWATPLLMLLLLCDVASAVTSAWRNLGVADVGVRLVLASLLAAGAYYVTASLVVPEDLAEGADLDAWFHDNKRFMAGGLLAANLLGFEVVQSLIKGPGEMLAGRWTGFSGVMNLVFYALVLVLMVVRNRVTELVMLATLNAIYVLVLLVF